MIFKAFDQKEIVISVWDEVKDPIGVVQIVHGMAEHTDGYNDFAAYLNSLGYVVYADNHRGHGLTDKDTLGYAKGDMFHDTVRDEVDIGKMLKEKYPTQKFILLGHSYGSFLTQKIMVEAPDLYDGVILYGSNYKKDLETRMGAVVASLGCLFIGETKPANILANMSFGAYEKNFSDRLWLCSDPAYTQWYNANPYCGFTCSFNFYRSFMRGLNRLNTKVDAAKLNRKTPVLVISGKDDPVGDMGKGVTRLYDFYRSLGMNVELLLIDGARHVVLKETPEKRKQFIDKVTEFIQK